MGRSHNVYSEERHIFTLFVSIIESWTPSLCAIHTPFLEWMRHRLVERRPNILHTNANRSFGKSRLTTQIATIQAFHCIMGCSIFPECHLDCPTPLAHFNEHWMQYYRGQNSSLLWCTAVILSCVSKIAEEHISHVCPALSLLYKLVSHCILRSATSLPKRLIILGMSYRLETWSWLITPLM